MEFADTLAGNLDLVDVTASVLDFEFSAGPVAWGMGDPDLTQAGFQVSTDENGNIVGPGTISPRGWAIGLVGNPAATGFCSTTVTTKNFLNSGGFLQAIDQGIFCAPGDPPSASSPSAAENPGTWTLAQVPEPTTLSLSALVLLGLAAALRRREAV